MYSKSNQIHTYWTHHSALNCIVHIRNPQTFSCEGSESEYFRVHGPHRPCCSCAAAARVWKQPQTLQKQVSVAIYQQNLNQNKWHRRKKWHRGNYSIRSPQNLKKIKQSRPQWRFWLPAMVLLSLPLSVCLSLSLISINIPSGEAKNIYLYISISLSLSLYIYWLLSMLPFYNILLV